MDSDVRVPTEVKLDNKIFGAKVFPVKVAAAEVIVISRVPLKLTPLICLVFASCVAELAFPVSVDPTKIVARTSLNELKPEVAVTFPVSSPTNDAVINPAENPPLLFLATIFPIVFEGVASTDHVVAVVPSKLFPTMYEPLVNAFVVLDLIVIFDVPSNGILLINLEVDNLSAVTALPVILPLIFATLDKLIPGIILLLIPAIDEFGLIVNVSEEHIAIGISLVSIIITGLEFPKLSLTDTDLARVVPNPATASGPTNAHSVPV